MKIEEAYTFDDVLLQPAHSKFGPADADVKTFITNDIKLNIPLLSAAMDTVTEHRLAITMAQLGGMGVLHKNFTIKDQASEVCLLYTSPSPRDATLSRMPSSA